MCVRGSIEAVPRLERRATVDRPRAGHHRQGPSKEIYAINIAIAAADITPAVNHPSRRSKGGLTRSFMIWRSLVSKITRTMSGGASTPFATADQNSIFTAFKPKKFRL